MIKLLLLLLSSGVLILTLKVPEEVFYFFFKFLGSHDVANFLIVLNFSENALHLKNVPVECSEGSDDSTRHKILLQKLLHDNATLRAPDFLEHWRIQRKMPDNVFVYPLMKIVSILLVKAFSEADLEFYCKEQLIEILPVMVLPYFEVFAYFGYHFLSLNQRQK